MKQEYPYKIQSHYPHMKPRDVHLWEKFIRANPDFLNLVHYDVAVGPGPSWMDTKRDEFAKKEVVLYKKKIDVLGIKNNLFWIIEVKPQAGPRALGQLLTYKKLFMDETGIEENVRLAIITNGAQNEYDKIFANFNIRLFEVGYCSQCRDYTSS